MGCGVFFHEMIILFDEMITALPAVMGNFAVVKLALFFDARKEKI